jgi:hypothetical protein
MGAVKNHVMGIEEDIFGIPSLDVKIGECECLQEAQDFVVDKLGLKTHFDIGIANETVSELWNEFWSKY